MNRDGLQRLVRAATSALGEDTVVVIGSQSILGSFGEFMLPPTATVSVEADLLPFDDLGEVKADTIDGLWAPTATSPRNMASTPMAFLRGRRTYQTCGSSGSYDSKTPSQDRSVCACIPRICASRRC